MQEEKRIAQEIELQSYLNNLIVEDKENQIAKIVQSEDMDADTINDKIHEIQERCVSIYTFKPMPGKFWLVDINYI